jgi:SAM-dependent methyltransferase
MLKNKTYFYACDDEAKNYDKFADLTDPAYRLMHEELSRQALRWLSHECVEGAFVIDFGCGTGKEGLELLRHRSDLRLIGIDSSSAMLARFREKLVTEFGSDDANGRCTLFEADIRDEQLWSDLHGAVSASGSCSLAVTACTLHHFSPTQKRAFYRRVANILPAGGLFANADLFSYEHDWLARYAQESLEQSVIVNFDRESTKPGHDKSFFDSLRDSWIRHFREENCPLPATISQLESWGGDSDQSLLLQGGFGHVECTFRLIQSAILLAFKPKK